MKGAVLQRAIDRPDLLPELLALDDLWPTFMLRDARSALLLENIDLVQDWMFCVIDPLNSDILLGRALTVPTPWDGGADLPDRGWDAAVETALLAAARGDEPTSLVALEITLRPDERGTGLAGRCLAELREVAAGAAMRSLYAPVRPTTKSRTPHQSMADFLAADGPADPWLSLHVECGGTIRQIAQRSMEIVGTFDDWHTWTGVMFDVDDRTSVVPGALVPVVLDHTQQLGIYIEPNVWVEHCLSA